VPCTSQGAGGGGTAYENEYQPEGEAQQQCLSPPGEVAAGG
jgi:hypothetical protein